MKISTGGEAVDLLLCRIHVDKGNQISLSLDGLDAYNSMSPGEILRKTVESKPSVVFKPKNSWSIGNVKDVDEQSLSFSMGCEKVKTEGVKDSDGNFTKEEREIAPHTRVILDWELEVCAIEPCSELGEKTDLPSRLSSILNNSVVAQRNVAVFEVRPIKNPEGFIQWIQNSHTVRSFQFTFSTPNFNDIEEDFQKPLEKMAKAMEGENNEIKFESEKGLTKENLADLTRAVIVTGHDVVAYCKTREEETFERRSSFLESHIYVHVEALENIEDRKNAIFAIRKKYKETKYEKESKEKK